MLEPKPVRTWSRAGLLRTSDPAGPRLAVGSSKALAGCSHPSTPFMLVRWLRLTFSNKLALEIWFSDFDNGKLKVSVFKSE